MYAQDFDRFRKVMDTLAELFGKGKLSDEALGAYWEALKDLHIAAVEREAQRHGRYGKFFPKPVELRPKDDKAPEPQDERAISASLSECEQNWERLRRESPERFWPEFTKAYVARLYFRYPPNSHDFRQALERCVSRCNEELEKLGKRRLRWTEIDTGAFYFEPNG